jgi:flagellin-like hook-associated protein FlgL
MVVQHNMQAANANRMLNVTTGQQAKSTEKLSSGYRINRAADDAAGLTISEKMRKQIKGLDRASTNAEDGVSAVQTAEGALTEVHSMLQRMNELATQASNGTNSESDRSAIQDEISQLTTEIDRVAETTKFNETYLLKGDTDGSSSAKNVNAHDAGLAGKLVDNGDGTSTFKLDKALEDGDQVTIAGKKYTIGSTTASTDGFEKLASLKAKSLSVGDSVTYTENNKQVTKTLVDKVSNTGTPADIYATGDKIKIDNQEYTIAAATDLTKAGGAELSAADAQKLVGEAIANGKEASFTSKAAATGMYAANATINVKIVADLGTNEVSSLASPTGHTAGDAFVAKNLKGNDIVAGDSVTISGKTITATDNDPANMSTVKDVVKSLQNGDVMQIGAKNINIADKTDLANDKYTVNDALSLLNDKNTVQFKTVTSAEGNAALTVSGLKAGTNYTAVDTKEVASDDNVISVKDAYSMMADELQKASSIGTDTAATVKSDNSGSFTINHGTVEVKNGLSFNLHVGADADMTNKINVNIDSMSASGLGIKGLNVKDDSGIAATYAIDAIADAISKVSEQRSSLGAVQNRLEHTISNVDNVVENTTSAESRIRDTDMASEMVNYSKNNILAQAGQSMLAQANQSNQGVLSLLQ